MTVSHVEADAINTLIEHLTGQPAYDYHYQFAVPDRGRAVQALAVLAASAHQRKHLGFDAARALEVLTKHWPGALRQVWMLEMLGRDAEPCATEQAARHKAITDIEWAADADLAWRTTSVMPTSDGDAPLSTLYVNGQHTLCHIWPATVHYGDLAVDTSAQAPDEDVAHCQVCGCTEDEPCEGGCAWVTDGSLAVDLCTACAWAIARDAVKSGLYQGRMRLPTDLAAAFERGDVDLDAVFEANGGLIPQSVLSEAEIDALQPLIAEVEAARGDVGKLEEIYQRVRAEGDPDKVPSLTRMALHDAAEMKANYLSACQTIAAMHKAAVGEVRGPIRGVIEDVEDIRARMLAAEALPASMVWQPSTGLLAGSPRFVAIARDIYDLDMKLIVVDLRTRSVTCQLRVDWGEWRPASAGHRLIENGYTIHAAEFFTPGNIGGWAELPGIGYITRVDPIETGPAVATATQDEPPPLRDVDPDAVYATVDGRVRLEPGRDAHDAILEARDLARALHSAATELLDDLGQLGALNPDLEHERLPQWLTDETGAPVIWDLAYETEHPSLRDVDPDAVYATEDDDYDDERAEAQQAGQDGDR